MQEDCTVYATMGLVSKRWSMLVLLEMHRAGGAPKGFNELKRGLCGITPKVLAARLRELEAEGLVSRRQDAGRIPARTLYTLTPAGQELIAVVKDVKRWALKWKVENRACAALDCSECGL